MPLFSHMTWRSKTNPNECCVTGGTAVFSQIHGDGHPSWERHQRSTGWPLWVLMHFFFFSVENLFSCDASMFDMLCVCVEEMATKRDNLIITIILQCVCVCSGHPRPVCGTVHPNGSGEQKKDQTHRQRHQPQMGRDLQFHLRPQPTERLGGRACLLLSNTVYSSSFSANS